jgi:hypothetical protein
MAARIAKMSASHSEGHSCRQRTWQPGAMRTRAEPLSPIPSAYVVHIEKLTRRSRGLERVHLSRIAFLFCDEGHR